MFHKFKKVISVGVMTSTLLGTALLADFHVIVDGKQQGPLSIQDIKNLSSKGSVNKDSLVWQDGMAGWEKASAQDELKSLFVATPPPPPPASVATSTPPPPPSPVSKATAGDVDETQNDLSSANAIAEQNPETLNDWKRDFEDKFGVTIGITEDGKTFFFGEAVVRVNPLDSAYAKELALTYDKAMLNLQSNFILQTYGDFAAQAISDEFVDDSTNAREFAPVKLKEEAAQGKVGLILDKFVDVVDKKLDAMLVEQGVPVDEIQKQTIEQKKLLFKDNFRKDMTKKAFASMSGLVPVQTKILTTSRGGKKTVKLGIIAIMSDKTVQFAKDMAKRRTTNVKGKPSSIKNILPLDSKGYLDEVGLRYVYDKKGRPMLISYGRWSVVGKTSNAARYERKIQNAKEKARMFAEANIGEFMKSNINAAQGVVAESINEEVASKISTIENNKVINEEEQSKEIGETLDKSFKKLTRSSKFKLRGTSQITTWEATDENGILHVGSVVSWTYSQLENANNIVNGTKKKKYVKKQKKKPAKNVSRSSRVVNSMDDF
jgi:hypothetical protein